MNASSHLVIGCGGAAVGLFSARAFGLIDMPEPQILTGVLIAGVGALFPDIDQHGSTINRTAIWMVGVGIALLVFRVALPAQLTDGMWLRFIQMVLPSLSLERILAWSLVIVSMMIALMPALTVHRGFTHSWVFAILMTFVTVLYYQFAGLPLVFGLCYGWGWVCHLLGDLTTDMGLPAWAWPFTGVLDDFLD